jgi:hypothetical protein
MEVNGVGSGFLNRAPLSVFEGATHIHVGGKIAKRKIGPIKFM